MYIAYFKYTLGHYYISVAFYVLNAFLQFMTTHCFNGHFPRWTWVSWFPPPPLFFLHLFLHPFWTGQNCSYPLWHSPTMPFLDNPYVLFHQPPLSYSIWPNLHCRYVGNCTDCFCSQQFHVSFSHTRHTRFSSNFTLFFFIGKVSLPSIRHNRCLQFGFNENPFSGNTGQYSQNFFHTAVTIFITAELHAFYSNKTFVPFLVILHDQYSPLLWLVLYDFCSFVWPFSWPL